jgi:quercetin dioxygenase-like cupin family protein
MPIGDTYLLHDGERVTVRVAEPGLLEVDVELSPLPHKPPAHSHPRQDERFEIREGELSVQVDGRTHVLRAGDALDVPAGSPHKMWNSGDGPCRASWQVRPALRTEGFFRAVHEAREAGRGGEHGMLTPLAAAPILREYRDEFALPLPAPVQTVALAALSALSRVRYGVAPA